MRKASAVAAITASSISTPGAIRLELPDSSRWDTTTARRDFRATSSRGSRPYGAKASRRHVEAGHLRGLRVDRQLVPVRGVKPARVNALTLGAGVRGVKLIFRYRRLALSRAVAPAMPCSGRKDP